MDVSTEPVFSCHTSMPPGPALGGHSGGRSQNRPTSPQARYPSLGASISLLENMTLIETSSEISQVPSIQSTSLKGVLCPGEADEGGPALSQTLG